VERRDTRTNGLAAARRKGESGERDIPWRPCAYFSKVKVKRAVAVGRRVRSCEKTGGVTDGCH
jgi:hypothetical protein